MTKPKTPAAKKATPKVEPTMPTTQDPPKEKKIRTAPEVLAAKQALIDARAAAKDRVRRTKLAKLQEKALKLNQELDALDAKIAELS